MTLEEIFILLQQILGTLVQLTGTQVNQSVEHANYNTETYALNAELAVINPTYGVSALHTQLSTVIANMATNQADLVTRLLAIDALLNPVTLPSPAPIGYGGGASATDVWAQLLNGGQFDAETLLVSAGLRAWREAQLPVVEEVFNKEGWLIGWNNAAVHYNPVDLSIIDSLDFSSVLPTDATVQSWLARVLPGNTYLFDLLGRPYKFEPVGDAVLIWKYGDIELAEYKAAKFGAGVTGKVPPVWPGIAGVTLGSAVALTDGLHISAAMSGVILKLTSVPAKYPKFDFGGGILSYRYLGSITFETDAGEFETVNLLGLNDCVYVPHTMAAAAGVRVHVIPGISGTIQPWQTV